MEEKILKKEMMRLWKDTFHDTDEYISLVFDNYFDLDFVEYYVEDGSVVSALLGVPYVFNCGAHMMKGLYLCGLATEVNHQKKGIMNSLIEKINIKALNNGYSFTFLIPASDTLVGYYTKRNYVKAIYRIENRYTNMHNFADEYFSLILNENIHTLELKKNYFTCLKISELNVNCRQEYEEIIKYIISKEQSCSSFVSLNHTEKDIHAIISENTLYGGKIITCSYANSVVGVAFVTSDSRYNIVIPKIYYDDCGAYYSILDYVKKVYADSSLLIYRYPEEIHRVAIYNKAYIADSSDYEGKGLLAYEEMLCNMKTLSKTYGMVRVLDVTEILKFVANYRRDVKFSILVKDDDGIIARKFDVCKGVFSEEIVNTKSSRYEEILKEDSTIIKLSCTELSEILFRKVDSDSIVMDAIGIPRIPINMSLLLD